LLIVNPSFNHKLTLPIAQNFTSPKKYANYQHPLLTATPPRTPIQSDPQETVFLILRHDEKISTKLFAKAFAWIDQNILHDDEETGGKVKENWTSLIAAIVHPDSTITYYKVYNGVHKPLEGTAGI